MGGSIFKGIISNLPKQIKKYEVTKSRSLSNPKLNKQTTAKSKTPTPHSIIKLLKAKDNEKTLKKVCGMDKHINSFQEAINKLMADFSLEKE